jgi:hypothetical protein
VIDRYHIGRNVWILSVYLFGQLLRYRVCFIFTLLFCFKSLIWCLCILVVIIMNCVQEQESWDDPEMMKFEIKSEPDVDR